MNSAVLTGRLIRDLELKYTQAGQALTSGVIAVDRKFKKNGEKVADFLNISVFGKLAELTVKYCGKKGDMLNVRGEIQTSTYNKRDGTKGYTVSIICEEVDFLTATNRQREETAPEAIATPPQQQATPPMVQYNENMPYETDDDDPFNLANFKEKTPEQGVDLTNFLKEIANGGEARNDIHH
jgi:single-strand DNA-binding protein